MKVRIIKANGIKEKSQFFSQEFLDQIMSSINNHPELYKNSGTNITYPIIRDTTAGDNYKITYGSTTTNYPIYSCLS